MVIITKNCELAEDGYCGYKITTDNGIIILGISSQEMCCEDWGYDIENMDGKIGARVLSEKFDLDSRFKKGFNEEIDATSLTIETDRGLIILSIWNEHNGYYPHNYIVKKSNGIIERGSL